MEFSGADHGVKVKFYFPEGRKKSKKLIKLR